MLNNTTQVGGIITPTTLFVLNDSGGKDSQAQRILVTEWLESLGVDITRQCITVHADLSEVEWPGALEHARDGSLNQGITFLTATSKRSFLQTVEERFERRPEVPCWPSSSCRQCTSDLKRGPIAREIRRYAKTYGFDIIINCIGERAEESSARAKRSTLELSKRNSTKTRTWFEWLPIHQVTEVEVFNVIAFAAEKPHPAYVRNSRLSCVFCFFGSKGDWQHGAQKNPELASRISEIEEHTGYTLKPGISLKVLTSQP